MDNKLKNLKYKDLMEKLSKSIRNEFYYEAIFIEFAILEDRTLSLLRHADLPTQNEKGEDLTLAVKLAVIKRESIFKDFYCKKHLKYELIESIRTWKNKRNILMHDLIKISYDDEYVKSVAEEGYEIVKKVNNKSTLVNKHLDEFKNGRYK